jgi:hypothetical protein
MNNEGAYEFKVIPVRGTALEAELNRASDEGYEWVDSLPTQQVGHVMVVMRRRKMSPMAAPKDSLRLAMEDANDL